MLQVTSDIEGKQAYYGAIRNGFEKEGFHICGNWEYYEAFFDSILFQNENEKMYLRLPVKVLQGKLDRNDAYLEFGRPFLIKHIMHTGLVEDEFEFNMLNLTGISQFREPFDPDDRIEHQARWTQAAEQAINRIKPYIH